MKFFKLTSFVIICLCTSVQGNAQGVKASFKFEYTKILGIAVPDKVITILTGNVTELSGKSAINYFDGEPSKAFVQSSVFGPLVRVKDPITGKINAWREGQFFITRQSNTPINFNVGYGYENLLMPNEIAYDKVVVSVGDYLVEETTLQTTDFTAPFPSKLYPGYVQVRGKSFSVDVSKMHPNAQNVFTKLLIIRFFRSGKIAKVMVLPITVIGVANSFATGAKYLSTGPGPRELNTILRAVPGDGSKSFINTSKSSSSEVTMALSTTNGTSNTLAYSVEAGMSAGPLSASAKYEASRTNSYAATEGKENTFTVTYTNSSQLENTEKSDLYVSSVYECEFGVGYNVNYFLPFNTENTGNNAAFGSAKLLIYPRRAIDNENHTEQELLKETIPTLKAAGKLGEAKFWEDAIAFNNKIKNQVSIKRTNKGKNSGTQSFTSETSSSVSLSQEVVISKEKTQKITLEAGLEIGPVSAGAEASAEQKFTFSSTKSFKNTQGSTNSVEVGYSIADDDKEDVLEVDIYEDGGFGSPVFKLVAAKSTTSCPYEGGSKLYQPSMTVQDPITLANAKTAKLSGLTLNQEVTFTLNLKNNSTTVRKYTLVVPNKKNTPEVTLPSSVFDMAAGESRVFKLKVRNSDPTTAYGFQDFPVILQADCDATVADTVVLSAYYGNTDVNRAPDNDLVCNAIELPVDGSIQTKYKTNFGSLVNLTTKNARSDNGENILTPSADCDRGWCPETTTNLALINNSVWFKFTTKTPSVVISTCSALNLVFDSQMAVYKATDCNDYQTFQLIAANDNGCGSTNKSSWLFLENLPIGATYYVLIDGFKGVQSDFSISVTSPTPDNDNACAFEFLDVNGLPNQGARGIGKPDFHYSNYLATAENKEQLLTPVSIDATVGWKKDSVQHSVWFAFEAPYGGEMTIDIKNANFDAQVSVYGTNGNICGSDYFSTYTHLGANDDISLAGGLDSRLKVTGLIPLKRYLILVDGYKGATGAFDIILSATPPINDVFCTAISLETNGISAGSFRNSGATTSDLEQILAPPYNIDGVKGWTDIADNRARIIERSVWFKFIAPSNGTVQISTCNQADFQVQLALYKVGDCNDISTIKYITADDNSGLCPEPPSPDYPNGRNVRGSIMNVNNLEPDAAYYIMVDGGIQGYGNFSITITTPPSSPPINDDVCKAIVLPTNGIVQKGFTNLGATSTDAETRIAPTNKWADATMNSTVWFTFIAPTSGIAEISTCDLANFDSQLAVYTATNCNDFTTFELIGANEDGPSYCATNGDNLLQITGLTPGKKYYLVVDGYAAFTGNFSIVIKDKLTPGPVNDDVTKAILLPVNNIVQKGFTNVLATATTLEQNIRPIMSQDCVNGWCDNQIDNSVWFKFVAPASGKVNISTCDLATFDTQLALYSATDVTNFSTFTLIAANDAGPSSCSTYFDSYLAAKSLTAGKTYYVMVDGFNGDMGNFDISLSTDAVSSTEKIDLSSLFHVFPNPFNNMVTIESPKTMEMTYNIQLVDITGRVISAPSVKDTFNHTLQIDMSSCPTGIFLLSIKTDKGTFSKKLVKH